MEFWYWSTLVFAHGPGPWHHSWFPCRAANPWQIEAISAEHDLGLIPCSHMVPMRKVIHTLSVLWWCSWHTAKVKGKCQECLGWHPPFLCVQHPNLSRRIPLAAAFFSFFFPMPQLLSLHLCLNSHFWDYMVNQTGKRKKIFLNMLYHVRITKLWIF